jgi:hypothetical protein
MNKVHSVSLVARQVASAVASLYHVRDSLVEQAERELEWSAGARRRGSRDKFSNGADSYFGGGETL